MPTSAIFLYATCAENVEECTGHTEHFSTEKEFTGLKIIQLKNLGEVISYLLLCVDVLHCSVETPVCV